jgi:hypothetical protein
MDSPTNFPATALTALLSRDNLDTTRVDNPKADPVVAVICASGGN